jgi:hypothetical protein
VVIFTLVELAINQKMQINLQPTQATQDLINRFRNSPEILGRAMKKGITGACLEFQSMARQKSPVDTTNLRNSISYQVKTNTEGRVFSNVEYAIYQEMGTGVYAGKGYIYPKRAKMLSWVSKSGKRIYARKVKGVKGRFYFKQAGESVQKSKNMDNIIYNELKKEL